ELAAEITRTLKSSPSSTAFRITRRNFFLGREIRYGGWGTDKPVRLFKRDLRYNANQVHEHVNVSGQTGQLGGSLIHYPYTSLDQYFEKFERYSRWWADQNYERGRRAGAGAVFFKPPARFAKMYLLKGGFRDGARGLVLACLAAASVMAKYARLWERSVRDEK
ncbi:MAG TPA: glycosyltransferase family 2 protein, partial [Gemmatimonadaceae bacterium]|nr:glycosyltransferase family 2 protein [Gemmatimonadaceae bacterium]